MQFATFKTKQGIKTGIVLRQNHNTVILSPVDFKQPTFIYPWHRVSSISDPICRNIVNNKVRVYPVNVIPIN